jgi:hypothetical protein
LRLVLPEKRAQNRVKRIGLWGKLFVMRLSNGSGIDPAWKSEIIWLGGLGIKRANEQTSAEQQNGILSDVTPDSTEDTVTDFLHSNTSQAIPLRQIRAVYDDKAVRVYQAYSDAIADSALAHGTFVSPPFKMERMTWIKPSFLWMMYRAGWGFKESGQSRILAIDITREGFEWALAHSCLSHAEPSMSKEEWERLKNSAPVRIQWDPERDLLLRPLPYRAIQIGLSKEAIKLYMNQWIRQITDVTPLAHEIHALVEGKRFEEAKARLPTETVFPASTTICD